MSVISTPISDKQIAKEVLEQLPDTATVEEICDEIELAVALRKSSAAADVGRVISHEELVRRSATWISK